MIYLVKRTDTGQYISASWVLRGSEQLWTGHRDVANGCSGAARLNDNDSRLMIEWQRENGVQCERETV